MRGRLIPYEAAFEAFLQSRRIPYVPANQSRRISFEGAQIKSFDFLLYLPGGRSWIVDVKGRRFPYGSGARSRYWENWVIQADIDSLAEWQLVFGSDFEGRFVFAYHLEGPPERWPNAAVHRFRGDDFAFLSVPLESYRRHCRARSARWETVTVPAAEFQRIAEPIEFPPTLHDAATTIPSTFTAGDGQI